MNISDLIKKVPGGIILIPMCVTAIINTIWPGALLKFGGPASGIFAQGAMVVIGMLLFVSGSQLKLNQLGVALARGGVLTLVRLLIGYAVAVIAIKFLGNTGSVWGISTMALVIIASTCNPGIYAGLMNNFGDNIDKAAVGIMNIIAVPATPLILLDLAGGHFNVMVALATIVPFVAGIIVGNIDPKMQAMLAPASGITLFFLGFSLGAPLNLIAAVKAGGQGVLLACFSLILLPIMILADKLILRRPGYAATAISTIGGIAIASPGFIAQSMPNVPEYAEIAKTATPQIALAMIIVAIVYPFIVKALAPKKDEKAAA